jgi:hypothetical protein
MTAFEQWSVHSMQLAPHGCPTVHSFALAVVENIATTTRKTAFM